MKSSIQKNVTLPKPLAQHLELKADEVGLSTSEYIRILIFNDTKDLRENKLSKKSELLVNDSIEAYKRDEYEVLDSEKKKKDFLNGE